MTQNKDCAWGLVEYPATSPVTMRSILFKIEVITLTLQLNVEIAYTHILLGVILL